MSFTHLPHTSLGYGALGASAEAQVYMSATLVRDLYGASLVQAVDSVRGLSAGFSSQAKELFGGYKQIMESVGKLPLGELAGAASNFASFAKTGNPVAIVSAVKQVVEAAAKGIDLASGTLQMSASSLQIVSSVAAGVGTALAFVAAAMSVVAAEQQQHLLAKFTGLEAQRRLDAELALHCRNGAMWATPAVSAVDAAKGKRLSVGQMFAPLAEAYAFFLSTGGSAKATHPAYFANGKLPLTPYGVLVMLCGREITGGFAPFDYDKDGNGKVVRPGLTKAERQALWKQLQALFAAGAAARLGQSVADDGAAPMVFAMEIVRAARAGGRLRDADIDVAGKLISNAHYDYRCYEDLKEVATSGGYAEGNQGWCAGSSCGLFVDLGNSFRTIADVYNVVAARRPPVTKQHASLARSPLAIAVIGKPKPPPSIGMSGLAKAGGALALGTGAFLLVKKLVARGG